MNSMTDYTISFTYVGERDGQHFEEEALSLDVRASDYEHASNLAESLSKIMRPSCGCGFYSASADEKK